MHDLRLSSPCMCASWFFDPALRAGKDHEQNLVPTSQLCENGIVEEIRTWWLDEHAIGATLDKLRKINARAAKHALNGLYAWRLGAEHREPVYVDAPGDHGPQEAAAAYYTVTRELIV